MSRSYRVLRGPHANKIGTLAPLPGTVYGGIYGYPLRLDCGAMITVRCDDVEEVHDHPKPLDDK